MSELTIKQIDEVAKKYAGLGGIEDYHAFAMEIVSIAHQSPAPIPEQVAQASGIEGLTRWMPSTSNEALFSMSRKPDGNYYKVSDVERLLATQSAKQAPVAHEVTQQAAKAEPVAEVIESPIPGTGIMARDLVFIGSKAKPGDKLFLAPTTSTVSATAEESRKDADWARAVAFASANQNVSTASASGQWKSLVDKAVDVLQRHIVPDGLSDSDAINLIYSIFDGAEYRAAQAATDKSED